MWIHKDKIRSTFGYAGIFLFILIHTRFLYIFHFCDLQTVIPKHNGSHYFNILLFAKFQEPEIKL